MVEQQSKQHRDYQRYDEHERMASGHHHEEYGAQPDP